MARLLAQVQLPSPSPALTELMARALATNAGSDGVDIRVKVAALGRAGRVDELIEVLRDSGQSSAPGAAARYALALIAAGRDDEACAIVLGTGPAEIQGDRLSKRAIFLTRAYCAARSGDKNGARLALNLARDSRADIGIAIAALEGGSRLNLPKSVDVLDYVFLRLGHPGGSAEIAAKATPELLFLLARDEQAAPELRVAAAERAAALNIADGTVLATAYRDAAPKLAKSAQSAPALRARLFATLEGQSSGKTRAESIDALLASGKDAKIEVPLAQALAEISEDLAREAEGASFAETGLRVAALAGDDQAAWRLTESGGDQARSWQLLLATTDPYGERAWPALVSGVDIALKSGLPGALLQRLVTVLDALGDVPIPLWELAAKTPQPSDGYLPATGVLTSLKEAADRGELGRTLLLAAAVLGPDGPPGAHLIGLGDALRALKRVGLEAEARRLGFEALYAHWPQRGKV